MSKESNSESATSQHKEICGNAGNGGNSDDYVQQAATVSNTGDESTMDSINSSLDHDENLQATNSNTVKEISMDTDESSHAAAAAGLARTEDVGYKQPQTYYVNKDTTEEQFSTVQPKPSQQKSIALIVEPETLTPSTPSQTPPQVHTPTTAAIPENILSPPKSETQTDETNTATSTSSSPASDTQMSPVTEQPATMLHVASQFLQSVTTVAAAAASSPPVTATVVAIPSGKNLSRIKSERAAAEKLSVNGTIPKSGKPLVTALNKKINKTTTVRAPRVRKPKASVPMYESEISDNKIGIKLCIKKSECATTPATVVSGGDLTLPVNVITSAASLTKSVPRKRTRKLKQQPLYSDDGEYQPRKKKSGGNNNNGAERQKKVSFSASAVSPNSEYVKPVDQSVWAERIPEEVLFQIFQIVVNKEGCLPTLFKLGRVCSLWRQVSLRATLWRSMDLTTWIKEKHRTELKLKWFVDNRCSACTDLNVSNWKVSDISCFLTKLANGCPNLMGITLAGWKGFTSDHLTFLVDNLQKLERLDLSSINIEMNASKSAVGVQSICSGLQTMGNRLTHLYLAHNRLAGIPQIVNILSIHCPNLTLLDLSNVTTQATSHGVLHIEKLQRGCQKLRVLRVTNSYVTPSNATMQETMESPGFPNLEELSVAALNDESRIIGDDHLQRILKSSSKLKLLDIRNCSRLTHESLIRLPAWDVKHLFLSGCLVTRDMGSGLELIASKWAHSLIELDLAWANVQKPLDNALRILAEKGSESPLAHLNLCGSSVSEDAVKDILANCAHMSSINLASCRGLPRGVKRLMHGPQELHELREVLKVQMKVKLPSQRLHEQQSSESVTENVGDRAAESGGVSSGSN